MEMLGVYEIAVNNTGRILRGIRGHHLDRATPCPGWDVGALIGHLIGQAQMYAAGGLAAGAVFTPAEVGDDPGWAYAIAAKATLDTFSDPAAAERIFRLPAGDVPGTVALNLAMTEAAVHGWDLATATGKSNTIDYDVAAALLAFHRANPQFRQGPDPDYGPEISTGVDLSATDRLVQLLGRQA